MTQDEFAEALRHLIGEAEDAGLELPQLIAALEDQTDAMRVSLAE